MKRYAIYTRNQTGTTLYHIGRFSTMAEARESAIKGFGWFRAEPNKYKIVISDMNQ